MIHRAQLQRLRQTFAGQFQPERFGYLYRKGGKGPAIRVNTDERDTFVADYNRRLVWMSWATVGATMAVSLGVGALLVDRAWPSSVGDGAMGYAAVGIALALFVCVHQWLRDAPARALRYRLPVAPALSRAEQGRGLLRRLRYSQLMWLGSISLFAVFNAARAWDLLHGWGRLWIVFGCAMPALAAIQAYRKWRLERADLTAR